MNKIGQVKREVVRELLRSCKEFVRLYHPDLCSSAPIILKRIVESIGQRRGEGRFKPAYFGLMVLRGIAAEITKILGEKRENKGGVSEVSRILGKEMCFPLILLNQRQ